MLNDSMVLDYMGKYEHFIHFKHGVLEKNISDTW